MTIMERPGDELDPVSSDGQYEHLYEQAPCGFLTFSLDGTITRVNQTFLDWTGYERAAVRGASIRSLLSTGSQMFYETRFVPVLRLEGRAREVEFELRRADGSSLHVLTSSDVDSQAEGAEVRMAVFDSTQRHTYERDLVDARRRAEASEARVRVLQDATSVFAECATVEAVAEALVLIARNAFAATEVSVMLLHESGQLYVAAGVHPLLAHLPANTLERGSEAIRRDDVFVLSTVDEAEQFRPDVAESMRAARIGAITATPIQSESGLFGVLHCSFGRSREFDASFLQLNQALARQASQVIARLTLQSELARLALHDQLTGLANRTLLQERMDEAIAGASRSGIPLAVLFVDLDGFKAVNDHLGHVLGDSVLVTVASRIREHVRATDIVGRFGGDEFVVLCPDIDEGAVEAVAERVRAAIGLAIPGVPHQFTVTASIGIALWKPSGEMADADALFRRADEAMYRAKNAGKDCVTLVRA